MSRNFHWLLGWFQVRCRSGSFWRNFHWLPAWFKVRCRSVCIRRNFHWLLAWWFKVRCRYGSLRRNFHWLLAWWFKVRCRYGSIRRNLHWLLALFKVRCRYGTIRRKFHWLLAWCKVRCRYVQLIVSPWRLLICLVERACTIIIISILYLKFWNLLLCLRCWSANWRQRIYWIMKLWHRSLLLLILLWFLVWIDLLDVITGINFFLPAKICFIELDWVFFAADALDFLFALHFKHVNVVHW